jgi:hypothetical protein
LVRTRNQAAAKMTPAILLIGIDYMLKTTVPTGKDLLAHLKVPSGLGELNVDIILRDAYHFSDIARGCTEAYLFADGGCAAFLSEVLYIHAKQWDTAVGLMQTAIPESVKQLLVSSPAFCHELPKDVTVLLAIKLLKTTTENHSCEGLKMIKALLFAEMGFHGQPWRGLPCVSNTKLTFNLAQRNNTWMPPTTRKIEVAVASSGGGVALRTFQLALVNHAQAMRLGAACEHLKTKLIDQLKPTAHLARKLLKTAPALGPADNDNPKSAPLTYCLNPLTLST